jgi:protein LTV1
MFRNEKLSLLDDQFDKILEEYSDDEIGELDPNDDEVQGLYDPLTNESVEGDELSRLDEMFDKFLSSTQFNNSETRLDSYNHPSDDLTFIRNELKHSAKAVVKDYGFVKDFDEGPIKRPGVKKERWDCETILSGMSNIYNRPELIRETSNCPKITFTKTGIPKVETKIETEDDISECGTVNVTIKRRKDETDLEKKIRKADVKESRKISRLVKKETKVQFKLETGIQKKMVPNNSMQKKIQHIQ